MKIGAFGKSLVFRVSDAQAIILNNMKREISASWSSIGRIGQKPLPCYQGPELQTMTVTIILDAMLGVKPRKMLKVIERLVEKGEAEAFVLGKSRVGKNRWVITKSSEAWDVILQRGELARATVSITLQEYL